MALPLLSIAGGLLGGLGVNIGAGSAVKAGLLDPNQFRKAQSNLPLIFPESLLDNPNRPQIRFTCFEQSEDGKSLTRHPMYFPCPPNIAFADNANLGTTELGIAGANLQNLFNKAITGKPTGVDSAQSAGGLFTGLAKLAGAGLKGIGGEKALEISSFTAKIISNPFQNTTYNGAGIRSFTFNFKLVAKSQNEANIIKSLHEKFRKFMYAGGMNEKQDANAAFIKYPAIWEIEFITGMTNEGYTVNKYLPAIFASYISAFNSTFNATSAAWHSDGAPLEVDFSITFQEARALTGQDIEALRKISDSGIATYEVGHVGDGSNASLRGITRGGASRATGWVFSEEGKSTTQTLTEEKQLTEENNNATTPTTTSSIWNY